MADDDLDFTDEDFDGEEDKKPAKPKETDEERIGREVAEKAQREPFEPDPEPDGNEDGTENAEAAPDDKKSRSQQRINQLIREREEERRRNAELQQRMQAMEGKVEKVSSAISEREAEAKQSDLDGKLTGLRKQYRDAMEAGDTDKQIELNESILDAKMEKRDFERRVESQKKEQPRRDDQQPNEQPAKRQPQAQAPQLSPEGHKWIGRNADWFMSPENAQEHNDARQMDVELYQEWVSSGKIQHGQMPNDPEYYKELDRRVMKKHPHIAPKAKTPSASSTPQGRSATGPRSSNNGGSYKFTKSEADSMMKMGLDPSNERDRTYWRKERQRSAQA